MNLVNWKSLLRRVPAFALLAVAIWLLGRIGASAWEWAQLEPVAPPPSLPAGPAENPAAKAPGSGLFGTPGPSAAAASAPVVMSGGEFRLRGVVASRRPGMAHAIIESRGESRAYFPGDALAPGLTLQEVWPTEVRLRQGAEILRLPLSGLTQGAARAPDPRVVPRVASAFRNDQAANILDAPGRMSLSQILRMESVMNSDGKMRGYHVFPRGRQGRLNLFDSIGLVPGDLVVAINGIPINSDNLPQATEQMNSGGDMMLTVEREGDQLEISVGLGLLAM